MLEFAEAGYTDRQTLFVEVILPLAIAKAIPTAYHLNLMIA